MKVKLYKGPANGKTYTVQDDRQEIVVAIAPKFDTAMWSNSLSPHAQVERRNVMYRMVMMTNHRNGIYTTYPATHPSGAVYFEYVE